MRSRNSRSNLRVINSLVRCIQKDQITIAHFQLVRPDLRLWIWELDQKPGLPWSVWIEAAEKQLRRHKRALTRLSTSQDFTLFVSIASHKDQVVKTPSSFLALLANQQLNLEIELSGAKFLRS